jgi:hypothetical protein
LEDEDLPDDNLIYVIEFDWVGRVHPLYPSLAQLNFNGEYVAELKPSTSRMHHISKMMIAKPGKNIIELSGAQISDGYGITIDNLVLYQLMDEDYQLIN